MERSGMIDLLSYKLGMKAAGGGGSGGKIVPLEITKNGVYEAKAGVTGPITWDGVVGDREIAGDPSSGAYHVKVFNEFLTKEDMIGGRFSISTSEQDDEIPENYCFSLSDMFSGDYGDSWALGEMSVVFADREFVIDNMSFTKGIYFANMPGNGVYVSSVTPNQTYLDSAKMIDGYAPVTVNVTSTLQEKIATENGEVVADSGYDGLSKVVVNVQSGSGGGSAEGNTWANYMKVHGASNLFSAASNSDVPWNKSTCDFSEIFVTGDEIVGCKTAARMFYYCNRIQSIPYINTSTVESFYYFLKDCKALKTFPNLDTSKGRDFSCMFGNCWDLSSSFMLDTRNGVYFSGMFEQCNDSNFTDISFLKTTKGENFNSMFNSCSCITRISEIDLRNAKSVSNMVNGCTKLTDLVVKNIKINLQIGSGTSWGSKLTIDSLVNAIYELHNVGESRTLTVGTANLEKLANVYVKLIDITDEMRAEDEFIDAKLPFVVCDSTDEGAILITDYVGEKNWTLA